MKITSIHAHLMGIPSPGGQAPSRNWIFVQVETDRGSASNLIGILPVSTPINGYRSGRSPRRMADFRLYKKDTLRDHP